MAKWPMNTQFVYSVRIIVDGIQHLLGEREAASRNGNRPPEGRDQRKSVHRAR
jgi:hypothetical protein